jgi:hypothetical protein
MDRYFQCLICKKLINLPDFNYRDQDKKVIQPELDKIICHNRRMHELNETQYNNMIERESWLNENGEV